MGEVTEVDGGGLRRIIRVKNNAATVRPLIDVSTLSFIGWLVIASHVLTHMVYPPSRPNWDD